MRILKYTFAALLIAVFLNVPVQAKETLTGIYKIYQSGEEIGAEKFTIKFSSDGSYKASGSISTKADKSKIEINTELETQGVNMELHAYENEVLINELPTLFAIRKEIGGFRIAQAFGIQKSDMQVKFHPEAMLLEPNVTHHLIPLVRKYAGKREGATRNIPVYLGTDMRETTAVLTVIGVEPVLLNYGAFEARRLFLNLGDVGLDIWVSPKNELLKVENPMQGFAMERLNYKGEKLEIQPAKRHDVTKQGSLSYEEITLQAGNAKLSCLYTRPKNDTSALPGIVFISDDGPQDRDGTIPFTGINIGTAQMMDTISMEGYAVLRCDDRGVAQSQGTHLSSTLLLIQADAETGLEYLKTRSDVNKDQLALIGHGAGGNVALRIAASRTDVNAVIALAPSSVSLTQLALDQSRKRMEEQGGYNPDKQQHSPLQYILDQAEKTEKKWLVLGKKAINLDVFREYARLNPMEDLAKVNQPLFIVQGGKDMQMYPEHGRAFDEACKNSSENCSVKFLPGLDHFFVRSKGTIAEYTMPGRKIDDDFLKLLTLWLGENVSGKTSL